MEVKVERLITFASDRKYEMNVLHKGDDNLPFCAISILQAVQLAI